MALTTKITLVILAVVVASASIWLGVLYLKIGRMNAELAEGEAITALKDKTIAEAKAAIDRQNTLIDAYKKDAERAMSENAAESARIKERYEYLLKEAKAKQEAEPTCENTLSIVENAMKGFLYE